MNFHNRVNKISSSIQGSHEPSRRLRWPQGHSHLTRLWSSIDSNTRSPLQHHRPNHRISLTITYYHKKRDHWLRPYIGLKTCSIPRTLNLELERILDEYPQYILLGNNFNILIWDQLLLHPHTLENLCAGRSGVADFIRQRDSILSTKKNENSNHNSNPDPKGPRKGTLKIRTGVIPVREKRWVTYRYYRYRSSENRY